ncbi:MAG: hypothetical protein C4548_00875 [Desulfobacteraceae bacterium]|nr:MAG: hypothetical protein C4548_00875 [Desulfobacteraceae bacterium]
MTSAFDWQLWRLLPYLFGSSFPTLSLGNPGRHCLHIHQGAVVHCQIDLGEPSPQVVKQVLFAEDAALAVKADRKSAPVEIRFQTQQNLAKEDQMELRLLGPNLMKRFPLFFPPGCIDSFLYRSR